MKDYSAISDFEINKAVADIAMNGTWHLEPSHPSNETGGWLYGSNGVQTYPMPDYCNNPADAWPIITENSIVIMPYMRGENPALWLCFDVNNSDLDFQDGNPLRAAMIVYLQMMEQKS